MRWVVFGDALVMSRAKSKLSVLASGESYDKDGRWVRKFKHRAIIWPIVERWVAEYGYHLVEMRGQRRVYQLGDNPKLFACFLEIRQTDKLITIRAWIEAGFWARALTGFRVNQELAVVADSVAALRTRRRFCHQLNSFLFSFDQPDIDGTSGFHWADLSASTIALMGLLVIPVALNLYDLWSSLTMPTLGWFSLQGWDLFKNTFTKPFLILTTVALALVVANEWFMGRREKAWMHWVSVCVAFFVLSSTAVQMAKMRRPTIAHFQVAAKCLGAPSSTGCQAVLEGLSPAQRHELMETLSKLQAEVARSN